MENLGKREELSKQYEEFVTSDAKRIADFMSFIEEEKVLSQIVQEGEREMFAHIETLGDKVLTGKYAKFLLALALYIRLLKGETLQEVVTYMDEQFNMFKYQKQQKEQGGTS